MDRYTFLSVFPSVHLPLRIPRPRAEQTWHRKLQSATYPTSSHAHRTRVSSHITIAPSTSPKALSSLAQANPTFTRTFFADIRRSVYLAIHPQ